jgi:hypothetical protein
MIEVVEDENEYVHGIVETNILGVSAGKYFKLR